MEIEHTLRESIAFWTVGACFFFAYVAIIFTIFMACRRLEQMENSLDRCKLIIFNRKFWGDSFQGRYCRMVAVWRAITFTKKLHKLGEIDLDQVKSFPSGFRKILQYCVWVIISSAAIIMVAGRYL